LAMTISFPSDRVQLTLQSVVAVSFGIKDLKHEPHHLLVVRFRAHRRLCQKH
jgi:hypothetical protein